VTVTTPRHALLGAAALALVLGAPAHAQNGQAEPMQDESAQAQTNGDTAGGGMQALEGQQPSGEASDRLIATVGDTEIRESDVREALARLPQQARQQPPQRLIPALVNQLILRELAAEEARAANLEEDPDVIAMVGENGGPEVMEEAMVRVWFQRELAERVSDEDVRAAYQDFQEANPDAERSLSEMRPQIERMLQRQAASAVGAELREDADIVFYDAEGEPMEQGAAQQQ
jgi:hypothetical protein